MNTIETIAKDALRVSQEYLDKNHIKVLADGGLAGKKTFVDVLAPESALSLSRDDFSTQYIEPVIQDLMRYISKEKSAISTKALNPVDSYPYCVVVTRDGLSVMVRARFDIDADANRFRFEVLH